ncbi:electron transport complex protein RnfC [Hypnocyclicus thermotrophus]|uniref:Ion-translocating oxidoreductase complex subunit C n=1 Tax=Hypnocyclicus thermotrophus TaxID=1627895 RepID=A0AA46E0I4_9FUSO|nr:electron transport complex subunit RsxC [Hypnocyclicus thermotrophus]TDT72422.1 electron transport complex protein RnfC [Hypnocyclicus thermotrophus]
MNRKYIGIHLKDKKQLTENKKIENFIPKRVKISLKQHIGTKAFPIVKEGEEILCGQVIAIENFSPNIHSSISGKIEKITEGFIEIKNDYEENKVENKKIKIDTINKFINLLKEYGIVGMGGAMFPTYKKFNIPNGKKIENLVINAAECEPYLNADNRVIIEKYNSIIKILEFIKKLFNIKHIIIGIEKNRHEAIKILENSNKKKLYKIKKLKTIYPQGAEKQLIQSIFNKEIKTLPIDENIVVLNISTCYAIYNAIFNNKPLTKRVVTISGEAIKEPKNLLVPIGTDIKELLEYCKINESKVYKKFLGGPMMGVEIDKNSTIIKGTNGVIAISKKEANIYPEKECISCGRCVDVCPMNLIPLKYVEYYRRNQLGKMNEYELNKCIKCGCCQYICPVNQPLMKAIWTGVNYKNN